MALSSRVLFSFAILVLAVFQLDSVVAKSDSEHRSDVRSALKKVGDMAAKLKQMQSMTANTGNNWAVNVMRTQLTG